MRRTNNIQAHIIKFRKSLIFGPTLSSFSCPRNKCPFFLLLRGAGCGENYISAGTDRICNNATMTA
uniref:Putative ovule protein n=1 Tax=Solanum chacoense TaxID=4108 RepID=A0A0V0HAH9_SOLCH